MQNGRPPSIRLPCFLLMAALLAPLFFFPVAAAAAGHWGRQLSTNPHGEGLLVLLGFGLSLGLTLIFVAYTLISTWPQADSDPRPEQRIDFLDTRQGRLAAGAFLAAQLLLVGTIVAIAVRSG